MRETTVQVAGYLLFAGQQRRYTLGQVRSLLPRIGQPMEQTILEPEGAASLMVVGQVTAFVSSPGESYAGNLGGLLEGFICTFLDSLRPRRPQGCRGWSPALHKWLEWPRETWCDREGVFEVGPAELFGLVRLRCGTFDGEVTRAVTTQRQTQLTLLATPGERWPRVLRAEET